MQIGKKLIILIIMHNPPSLNIEGLHILLARQVSTHQKVFCVPILYIQCAYK